MRLRKKKNTVARLAACDGLLLQNDQIAAWCDTARLCIEIGAGKGGFITELARQNPDIRYIAVEKERDCIVMALEKAARMGLENLRFLPVDACKLRRMLPHRTFETIYLNFSDPWPKQKYAARRLTHRNMLRFFLELLTDNGQLRFKTDNDALFAFTVEEFRALGFDVDFLTYDLHREATPNVVTEYEARFSKLGVPIKAIWARPNERVFEALRAYEAQADRFRYHEMILDLTRAEPIGLMRLLRALDRNGLPVYLRTDDADLQALAAPLVEQVLPASAPLPRTEPEDTAFVSDRADALRRAASLCYYTVAIALPDESAQEHYPAPDAAILAKNKSGV